jgi:putative FmdB family regulatory protein
MPIYEYRCESCGFDLEKLQRINDDPLVECPKCGKPELRRLVSAAGFRLKGAGWYETDFKKSGKKNLHETGSATAQSADKASDKPADKPADTKKTESKPAAVNPGAD